MASIRCAHCKGTHGSVAEVRQCAQGYVPAAAVSRPASGGPRVSATNAQVKFIVDLIGLKDLTTWRGNKDRFPHSEVKASLSRVNWGALDKVSASKMIDGLLKLPDVSQEATSGSKPQGTDLPDVPAGHYAINGTDADARETRFYRVDRPTEGRWAGRTFLKVQSSDEFHPIRNRHEIERVLLEIAMDPQAAGVRYGREIGRCYLCNRTLTDDASREAGIGPICANK